MSKEIPKIREQSEIKHEAISELEIPLKKILKEMLPNIENGEYDLIIGVDASGRIPTLILEQFIRTIYSEKGLNQPVTRFVSGRVKEEESAKKIIEWNTSKKALLIDDILQSGNSIKYLCQALRKNNIFFDIAVITGPESITELRTELGAGDIYLGSLPDPAIYGRNDLSGVIKKEVGEAHSVRFKGSVAGSWATQTDINQARSDADLVAKHLINWYESTKNGE